MPTVPTFQDLCHSRLYTFPNRIYKECIHMETPEKCALAKCEELERELKRSPDFQLYLLTQSRSDRARMESVLIEIPKFALWLTLARSVKRVRGQFDGDR